MLAVKCKSARGARNATPKECRRRDAADPHDAFGVQSVHGLGQGEMDRDRDHAEAGTGEHHRDLRRFARGTAGQLGQEFSVARMAEAGVLQSLLLDGVGHDARNLTRECKGRAALDAFEAEIKRHPEVTECCLLAGTADYMVRVAYADAADFERIHTEILTQLPGVVRVQSTLALRTVKKTTALPV